MKKEFVEAIHQYIRYWDKYDNMKSKEKMEGLAFSILCMLDGVSGSFSGNIQDLCEGDEMLHEMLHKEKGVNDITPER